MSYGFNFDASEPVRQYHRWEDEIERRQALRRDPLDPWDPAELSSWSLLIGLAAALHGGYLAMARLIAPPYSLAAAGETVPSARGARGRGRTD